MTVEMLARFLNQISQTDYHYDDMPEKIKKAYRHKAEMILDFLATEPAREKDGCFRCRNRPLPGASGELCKSCKLVIGKNYDPIPIIATEPEKEGL